LFALVDATADRCAWTFVNEVCLRYGIPRKLISDKGTQFRSAIMQKICFCLEISKAFTAVYHPEANPVERRNRDLKTQLAIQIRDKPHSDWPRQLSSIRFAMNTARSQSTGKTPAFLLFGNEIRSIDDVTNAVWSCLKISLLKPHPDFYNSMKAGRKLERPTKRNKIAVSSTPTSNAGLPPRSNPVTSCTPTSMH
jgi:hypothetical protein